jgi:molybdopterin converting factor small subunit
MRITFFGRLADSFGRTVELDAPAGSTIADLRRRLALTDRLVRACVGDTLVDEDFVVAPGQEVEFWPPVSGG